MKKKRPIPNPHDVFFRRIFGRPEVAAEFFRLYLPPEVAERLDLSRVKLEDTSFVDEKLREHFSDLLFRVGLKQGGEAYVYILLEHKSAPDERVALQLLRYVAQAWDRLSSPLPLIVPVVVYHGAAPWRVEKSLSGLFDPAVREPIWRRYLPDFEYYLCDLSRYSDEELKGAEGLSAALKLTMVSYLTESQRVTEAQISEALFAARTEGGRMETVFDRLEKELIQRCLLQGREEGREEGRQKGAVELILVQLRRQVGKLDQEIEGRVRALPVAKLKRLGESLLGFESQNDLKKWLGWHAGAALRKRASR